ncbi:SusC/RagA family TonB-linked outer membrane protein [Bacteroidia bacterium]|nr:SusC/RagA family TonB-linked outer membrane protein [Bacteroidia bacterium]
MVCLLISISGNLAAQGLNVSGMLLDSNNDPIVGATVTVKGTNTGVTTGINGEYDIAASPDATLVYSFMGMDAHEEAVGGRGRIDVVMVAGSHEIEETVIIGYGTTRKQDLSMAVSTMKVDQTLKSQTSNLATILQGKIPGLTVQLEGGDPLKGASYNIRGRGSRDHDGVLWVVDGVPGAPYNMEDVESITVLKDAASAAIYGARVGASGVILITTKRAQAGKLKVDVNVSHGFKSAWKLPEVVTAEQYSKLHQDAVASPTNTTSATLPPVADPSLFPYGSVTRTDWLDEVFRTGQTQHYAVSLSGGTETLKALASFSYDKNDGILLNTWAESFGGKINLDLQLAKWLKFSERASFSYSNGQGDVSNDSHQGVLMNAIFYPRSATVYEYAKDGTPVLNANGEHQFGGTIPLWALEEGITGYGEIQNPVAKLTRMRQNRPSANIYSTSSLEIKPISSLSFHSDFTAALSPSRYEEFNSKVTEWGRRELENSRVIESWWNSRYLWENIISYAEVFGEHHISAMAGYTYQYETGRSNRTQVYDFGDKEDEHFAIFGNANDWNKTKPSESIWEEDLASALGRVGYSYGDRYFATASLRYDVSSKLHPDNNSGVFPSFSASWKISSEEFFKVPVVNLLKLRGGWGQVGNVNSVNRYSYNVPLENTRAAVIGQDMHDIYGVYQRTISNRDLTWETSEQISAGLDAALLDNSLNVTIDYFHKTTKDLVDNIPISHTAGIETEPKGNVGKVLNKGWEFGANYTKKFGEVTASVFGNLSTVKSEVLSLGVRDVISHGNAVNSTLKPLSSEVGQAWYSYHLIKTDGIFQTDDEIENYTWTDPETGIPQKIQPNAIPGDLKFIDFNDDGQINDKDRQYMKSYLPELTYSFGANLAYKGFDFSFFFSGISGVNIFNGFKLMGYNGNDNKGHYMLADVLNSWTYDKTSSIPRIVLTGDPNFNYVRASDFFLEDGSYLRLKNVTLGYSLPKSMLQKIGMGSLGMRLYVTAENLLTFTDYSGFDPEVGRLGLDAGNYPISRNFIIGLNFNF